MSSCLAATSMPRVGSSRISTRGCVASQRAMMAFCWLPPESWPMGVSMLAVLMPSAATSFSAICALLGRASGICRGPCAPAAPARCSRAPTARRRCRCACDPRGRSRGRAPAHRRAVELRGWPSMRISPESRASSANSRRASSVRPEPNKPARPSTSPARNSRSTGLSWPRRERLRAASTGGVFAGCRGRAASRIARPPRASRPTIAATRPRASSLRAGVFADELAVAQHRDAIADLVDLVEEVRDEQDGDALVAQAADQREQRLHFVGVEARGRLVEDQHARIGGDGARHGGELLQGRGQTARELRHVEVDAEAGQQFARAPLGFAPVDAAAARPRAARIAARADVLRHRQVRQQVAFLVHGADAEFLRVHAASAARPACPVVRCCRRRARTRRSAP